MSDIKILKETHPLNWIIHPPTLPCIIVGNSIALLHNDITSFTVCYNCHFFSSKILNAGDVHRISTYICIESLNSDMFYHAGIIHLAHRNKSLGFI